MDRLLRPFFFFMLFAASPAVTAASFMVSNSAGTASISNLDSYDDVMYLRLDVGFFPIPQIGFNIFINNYDDFQYNEADSLFSNTATNAVDLVLKGRGVGVTGRWPVNAHFQPYLRAEYFDWDLEARSLDRTVGKDSGGNLGIAVGAHFPIRKFFGFKAEAIQYNDISGADIDHLALGLVFEF